MRIGGLASGFDTEQIVDQLMQVERLPLDRIYQQKIRTEWQRDQYRALMTKITSFRDLVFNMQLQSNYMARLVSSSDESVVKAQVAGQAQYGIYEIKVDKLATSAVKISANEAKVSQQLEALVNDESFTGTTIRLRSREDAEYVEVAIGPGETINSFVQKINQNKELGITVLYDEVTDALVFRSNATGSNAVVQFDDDFDTQNFVNQVLLDGEVWGKDEIGEDAEFVINGLRTQRESNSFTFAGLNINLRSVSDETVKLEVVQDTDRIVDSIKTMVEKYNELLAEIQGKINEPFYRDYPPLTEAQKKEMDEKDIELWEERAKSGLLRSDRILTNLVSEMRRAIGSIVEGIDGSSSLSKIGITTGGWYEYGKLHINETQLRKAVQNNPDEVIALFTNNGATERSQGVVRRLNSVLTTGMNRLADTAGKTTSLYDTSTLSEKIRSYEEQIAVMEERMIQLEARYWKKFVAMERALQQMYAQSDWLYQQLAVMTNG
ncbi:MAG TPA: flagellar filament capping protein FliD [Firmicutes bacterium]|nr:flagellar filament capping protein FliD [Bacillota bacterium]